MTYFIPRFLFTFVKSCGIIYYVKGRKIRKCWKLARISVKKGELNGTVSMPPSKSVAHRAIICASLSDGKSVISPVDMSNDIVATVNCMKALGADIQLEGNVLTVNGKNIFSNKDVGLDCGESGSTLRFLVPVCCAGGITAEFTGHGKLPERPIGIYLQCLPEKGINCKTQGGLPLKVSGKLESGIYSIAGNVSSQFITGLLLSLPMLEGDSEIILTTELQSSGYIDMTTDIMGKFGVEVKRTETGWKIKGGQKYTARDFTVEGDWSQAAFFMTAAAISGKVTIDNLDLKSYQRDKECFDIYKSFGADVTENDGKITIQKNKLKGIEINAENIPDMVPALSVVGALAEGVTVIKGAERLRIKECDRLAAMADGLSRMGADIKETADGFIIHGVNCLKGADVDGYNDHRIVMSLAAAAFGADGEVIISDMESINKSYPKFFEDYRKIGGKADVIMGE